MIHKIYLLYNIVIYKLLKLIKLMYYYIIMNRFYQILHSFGYYQKNFSHLSDMQ